MRALQAPNKTYLYPFLASKRATEQSINNKLRSTWRS